MKLLFETHQAQIETQGRKTFITGRFLVAEEVNHNKRRYPFEVLHDAVEARRNDIKNGGLVGMLGHPPDGSTDPSQISHVITTLEPHQNYWEGKARLVDEGAGRIAKSLIDAGARLGVSSRGYGNVKEGQNHSVVTDFQLLAIDIVNDPSTPGAFVTAVTESLKKMPLTEANFALDVLQNIPGIGDQLANLQRRNGYDWDNKAGLAYRGHPSFPSIADESTWFQRCQADLEDILRKLAEYDAMADNPGLTPAQTRYIQALLDKKVNLERQMADEQRQYLLRRYTSEMLHRAYRSAGYKGL
jgi:hypothetical protein